MAEGGRCAWCGVFRFESSVDSHVFLVADFILEHRCGSHCMMHEQCLSMMRLFVCVAGAVSELVGGLFIDSVMVDCSFAVHSVWVACVFSAPGTCRE